MSRDPSSIPVLKPRKVVRILKVLGFTEVRQRGSHKRFRHAMDAQPPFPCMVAVTCPPSCFAKLQRMSACLSMSSFSIAGKLPRKLDSHGNLIAALGDDNGLGADVFALQMGFSAIKKQRDHFLQVVVKLLQSLPLAVRPRKPWHMANIQGGVRAAFDNSGVDVHRFMSQWQGGTILAHFCRNGAISAPRGRRQRAERRLSVAWVSFDRPVAAKEDAA